MLQTLIERIFQTYKAPRAAVRSVIRDVRGPADVAMIFALSFCLNSGVIVLASLFVAPASDADAAVPTGAISFVVSNVVFSTVAFAVITALIWRVGKALGGTGGLLAVATAVAWHSLVTAIFAPFLAASTVLDAGSQSADLLSIAQVGMVVVVLWLFANFIAEAHGFQSAWRVAGVLIGGMMGLAFVLSIVLTGVVSQT